jgi:hypothetical protein
MRVCLDTINYTVGKNPILKQCQSHHEDFMNIGCVHCSSILVIALEKHYDEMRHWEGISHE